MELNVAQELKLIGVQTDKHLILNYDPIEFNGTQFDFAAPLCIDLSYAYDGEGFNVKGRLSSTLRMNCTKCNQEFFSPFEIDFAERFVKAFDEASDEMDCYPFAGEVLELDQMILDLIILNAPMYGVCKEDCKGLCPSCGCNLNLTQCSCSDNDVKDSGFASLKEFAQLLNDEEEV